MVILVVVLGSDLWVHFDAARHRDAGVPVVVEIGSLRVESPET